MPIRRAAATPPQEKIPSAAAEKGKARPPVLHHRGNGLRLLCTRLLCTRLLWEASSFKAEGSKMLKDGYKYEKSKGKKVKRTIPAWASIASNKKVPVTNYAGTQHKLDNILVEAITSFNSRSGVSYQSLFKYIVQKYPSMDLDKKKFLIKKAMKKQLGNGSIKQLKGKGLSGTFAIGKVAPASKVYIICNLPTAFVSLHDSNFFNCPCPFQKTPQNAESLGDALPLIITRLCQPKEASYTLIKKYLMQHFPALNVEKRPDILKAALVRAIEKGQVEQITGKGASGTFQLKRPGNKIQLKGSTLDDAIVAAITAMNEPKTCSTTTLRKHLVDANKDRKEHILGIIIGPNVIMLLLYIMLYMRTLTKCKVLGWMEQITGHGFTGTYRLSFPYYPSPTVLYPDRFKELEKTPVPKRRKARSDDEEEESEAPVHSRSKRPPPKARRPPPSKSRSTSRSKSKASKKLPVKKVTPSKKMASKPVSKKVSVPVKKATPVKKGAPAKKPKTPAVKKMASRAAKRPAPRDLSSDEEEEDEEDEEDEVFVKAPKKTAKGRSNRSKPEESPAPPAKKQATKSVSRAALKQSKPAAKKGAKSSAQSARKSKRGKR
uniref:Heterochromatin protein 1-binding protein 3 n=1 Tax=Periophthalmus magnuspinnatus TaxID=409849 RepID=A0A3B4AFU2_9GOBI